jgi:hypothetical protein
MSLLYTLDTDFKDKIFVNISGLYYTLNENDVDVQKVERLLKGWCRTRLPRPDGQEVDLVKVVETADDIHSLLRKYNETNEFAIAMLAGKSYHTQGKILIFL